MSNMFWPGVTFTGGIVAANIAFAAASFTQKVPVPNYCFKIVQNTGTVGTFLPGTGTVTEGIFLVPSAHLCIQHSIQKIIAFGAYWIVNVR